MNRDFWRFWIGETIAQFKTKWQQAKDDIATVKRMDSLPRPMDPDQADKLAPQAPNPQPIPVE